MKNFKFVSPTKIIFGKNSEKYLGNETKLYGKKVLLHYGGGSIKKIGVYDKVVNQLNEAGIEFIELGGAMPNPRLSLVEEGIKLCRDNNIDFILAVGGGSAIDSAKAIAVGVPYQGDVWDFYSKKAIPEKALPVGVVLTLPATGSEASNSSVITNEDGWYKYGLNDDISRPVFSILNPEFSFTLPPYQTSCGAADIMAHVLERYFTNIKNVDLTDRLSEAVLKTVILNAPKALENANDYDARAEIMWAGTIAHNGLLDTGRIGDWASHKIEHELSAIYDIAHGAGLSIIIPAWMKYVYKHDIPRFAQFAHRVWNVDLNMFDLEQAALEGINRLEAFFKSIDLPIRLSEMDIDDSRFDEMTKKCLGALPDGVGAFVKLHYDDVMNIYKIAK